jgi:TonB family protein
MSRITTQSLFETSLHKSSWRSYAVSMAVHAGVAALAFALILPVAVEVERADALRHFTLLAPVPEAKPLPEVQHLVAPPKLLKHALVPPPKTFVPPPVVVPPVKRPEIVEPPEITPVQPQQSNVELPPPPKVLTQAGVFHPTTELAKTVPTQTVQVGGFGDPNGARPSDNSRQSPVMLTKVGAFDLPENTGHNGGGGKVQNGNTIRQTGFGSTGDPGRPRMTNNESIRSTAFGDATLTPPPSAKKAESAADGFTPVEILFKPKPAYTVEAREMRLEGEVSLQVVFQASGTIRVVRVVQGLGHGLDEAAQQAALRVRFKPAKRGGVPVDTNATIKISFELT